MKKATLKDIAEKTGISKSTISMYLSGNPKVWLSKEKREKIDASVRELHYRPDLFASALRTGSTRTIGLVLGTLLDPLSAATAEGSLLAAEKLGYQLLIASVSPWNREREASCLKNLIARRVDGICYGPDPDFSLVAEDPLKDSQIPVFFGSYPSSAGKPHIEKDYSGAFRFMLDEMLSSGAEKIALCFHELSCHRSVFESVCTGKELSKCSFYKLAVSTAERQDSLKALLEDPPDSVYFDHCAAVPEYLEFLKKKRLPQPKIAVPYTMELDLPYLTPPAVRWVIFSRLLENISLQIRHLIHIIEHGTTDPDLPMALKISCYEKKDFLKQRPMLADTIEQAIDFNTKQYNKRKEHHYEQKKFYAD